MPDKTIVASYRLTVEEAVAVQLDIDRPKWKKRAFTLGITGVILLSLVVMIAVVAASTNPSQYDSLASTWVLVAPTFVMVGMLLAFGVIGTYVLPKLGEKTRMIECFSEQPGINSLVKVTINSDSIVWETQGLATNTMKWDLLFKVIRTPKGFLILPQENRYQWLPNHAFESEDDVETLNHLAQQYAPRYEQVT